MIEAAGKRPERRSRFPLAKPTRALTEANAGGRLAGITSAHEGAGAGGSPASPAYSTAAATVEPGPWGP
ncbi:MAG: hypothetical protein ACRDN0_29465 [Trebonia sp.]